jgi:hypothetical protein
MVAVYHLSHLIAVDLGRERIAARAVRDPRPRRLSSGVLRGAWLLRRVPRRAAAG